DQKAILNERQPAPGRTYFRWTWVLVRARFAGCHFADRLLAFARFVRCGFARVARSATRGARPVRGGSFLSRARSTARHKYQAATDRSGAQRAPNSASALGRGIPFKP